MTGEIIGFPRRVSSFVSAVDLERVRRQTDADIRRRAEEASAAIAAELERERRKAKFLRFVAGVVVVFVAFLFAATCVGAEERPPSLKRTFLLHAAPAVADLAVTEYVLRSNPLARESNGLMLFNQHTTSGRVASNAVTVGVLTVVDYLAQRAGAKGFARFVRIAHVGGRGVAIGVTLSAR
jgi:hypothetical protein